jgi:uncharacterized protein with PIN domain/mRNA deadenylase 3'-5' endonuclease subunit Ccr4
VNKFTLVNYEIIRFDDLATLQQPKNLGGDKRNEKDLAMMTYNNIQSYNNSNNTTPPELTGMVRSFLRRNCAIVAHLKSIRTNESIYVTSVHIYWHPAYEYVKLCQAKYLLDYVAAFAIAEQTTTTTTIIPTMTQQEEIIPSVIICGDINSKPGSVVHKFFVESHVDARTVAPWRYFWDQDNEEMYTEEYGNNAACSTEEKREEGGRLAKLISQYEQRSHNNDFIPISNEKDSGYVMDEFSTDFNMLCGIIHDNSEDMTKNFIESTALDPLSIQVDPLKTLPKHCSPQDYEHATPPVPVKYMLDYTLNRFTRWLRLLGIDARLERSQEEKERTSGGRIALFDHCKNEQRTLLTTSYKLLLRKDCPPGAYLLEPKVGGSSQMEFILPRLLRTHGVELTPCTFLTRCVLCNGDIKRITTDQEKRDVFIQHDAPCLLDSYENFEVFRCTNCGQGYWWDDRPSSSASRSFDQAKKLLQICLRGGVALKDEHNTDKKTNKEILGAFAEFVDVAKERTNQDLSATETDNLAVIDWLNEEKLSRPFKLKSVMAMVDTSDESIPFTTVTKEFVSTLDYIFYSEQQFEQIGKLTLPTSFKEMNPTGIRRGHLIPSDIWPSDHIAVGARLRLKRQKYTPVTDSIYSSTERIAPSNAIEHWNSNNIGKTHPRTCSCGCIPQILSMFEMAELRKKAREEAKKAEAMAVKS